MHCAHGSLDPKQFKLYGSFNFHFSLNQESILLSLYKMRREEIVCVLYVALKGRVPPRDQNTCPILIRLTKHFISCFYSDVSSRAVIVYCNNNTRSFPHQ